MFPAPAAARHTHLETHAPNGPVKPVSRFPSVSAIRPTSSVVLIRQYSDTGLGDGCIGNCVGRAGPQPTPATRTRSVSPTPRPHGILRSWMNRPPAPRRPVTSSTPLTRPVICTTVGLLLERQGRSTDVSFARRQPLGV